MPETLKCQICNKPGEKSEMQLFARPVVVDGRPTWYYFGAAHNECQTDFLSDLEKEGKIQRIENEDGWEILDPAKLPHISFEKQD